MSTQFSLALCNESVILKLSWISKSPRGLVKNTNSRVWLSKFGERPICISTSSQGEVNDTSLWTLIKKKPIYVSFFKILGRKCFWKIKSKEKKREKNVIFLYTSVKLISVSFLIILSRSEMERNIWYTSKLCKPLVNMSMNTFKKA